MSFNAHPTDIGLEPTPQQHADDFLKKQHVKVEAKGVSEQASATLKPEESSPDSLPLISITANKLSKTMPIILIASNCAATILLLASYSILFIIPWVQIWLLRSLQICCCVSLCLPRS